MYKVKFFIRRMCLGKLDPSLPQLEEGSAKTPAARETFQPIVKRKAPWRSFPVSLLRLTPPSHVLEGGGGPQFSASERGSKPHANKNAKANRE